MSVSIIPLSGIPMLRPGDDLAEIIFAALARAELALQNDDILVICQKAVSKVEGRIVDLDTVTASAFAIAIASTMQDKDARVVELVLRETTRIVKMQNGHLIVETGPGWVCANAGIDESNSGDPNCVVLLPEDPDASARRIMEAAERRYSARVGVIVTDTFGRPWRVGLVDFALGVAGIPALLDLRGGRDLGGRELHHTVMAQADALAAAAGLVMTKDGGIPAVLVRGYAFAHGVATAGDLIRPRETDLFR